MTVVSSLFYEQRSCLGWEQMMGEKHTGKCVCAIREAVFAEKDLDGGGL